MNLLIGCSASKDIPEYYFDDCRKFLNIIMKENNLVFGACYSGLMAIAHDITKEYGNEVIGVCPTRYIDDFKNLKCDKEIVTDDLNGRTTGLVNNADALIFLPGGIGTIYELYTAIECKRCHEFDKPIVLYNSKGYFDKLLEFMQKIYDEKFAKESDKQFYFVSTDADEILNYIKSYKDNK